MPDDVTRPDLDELLAGQKPGWYTHSCGARKVMIPALLGPGVSRWCTACGAVDEVWTRDPDPTPPRQDLVEVVARRIWTWSQADWLPTWEELDGSAYADEKDHVIEKAKNLLAALSSVGALMPDGGETWEERGTRIGDGSILTLAEAGTRYSISAQSLRRRTVTTYPDGHPLAGTHYSPWRAIDD